MTNQGKLLTEHKTGYVAVGFLKDHLGWALKPVSETSISFYQNTLPPNQKKVAYLFEN